MTRPLALAAALVLSLYTYADGRSPSDELRGFFAVATRILHDPALDGKPEERFLAIRALAREMFDFREAARLALGRHWDTRTAAEQEQFVALFSDLLERSFIGSIASKTQIAGGLEVNVVGEAIAGRTALVRTTMLGRNGHELPIDYRLAQEGDRWVVRDVLIEGVSAIANYRAQFARIIQSSSYAALVKQMEERRGPALAAVPVREALLPEPAAALPPDAPGRADAATPVPAVGATSPSPSQQRTATARAKPPIAAKRAPDAGGGARLHLGGVSADARPSAAGVRASRPGAPSYWVQVAAFKSPDAARRLATSLRSDRSAADARLAVIAGPDAAGAEFARVRLGPYPDRRAAATRARDLEARGYKPFIAEERD